jgi:uncharacterized protein (DUF362 family)
MEQMKAPLFVKIRQHFPRPVIKDVQQMVRTELKKVNLRSRLKPGQRVAITAGSRGIKNIVAILRTVAEEIRAAGAEPFVVAAMGSHGGGSAEGQKKVLASLGITESSVGCPVMAADEVVEVGRTASGKRVFCDALAWEAGAIVVVNRIKPHTTFHGPVESGLLKMMAVGLGKARGASVFHRTKPGEMSQALLEMGEVFLCSGRVVAGLAVVENGYEETAIVEAAPPEELVSMETRLLKAAYHLLPRLPVDELDFLVVREMGKNISGTGMDVNVIGRMRMAGVPEPERPFIARIVVLDLTDESHGNATGIGLADFTTARLVEKIDRGATYLNCITSGNVQRAMLPIVLPGDQEAFEAALRSLGAEDTCRLRGAIIKNTLELEYLWVTANLVGELACREGVEIITLSRKFEFKDVLPCLD